jgi:hypothetical protein
LDMFCRLMSQKVKSRNLPFIFDKFIMSRIDALTLIKLLMLLFTENFRNFRSIRSDESMMGRVYARCVPVSHCFRQLLRLVRRRPEPCKCHSFPQGAETKSLRNYGIRSDCCPSLSSNYDDLKRGIHP